jgi:hypothetical protein
MSPELWAAFNVALLNGSYAVLVAIAIVYIFTRAAIGKLLTKHFRLLEANTEATLQYKQIAERNSRTILQQAATLKQLSHSVRKLTLTNAALIEAVRTETTGTRVIINPAVYPQESGEEPGQDA